MSTDETRGMDLRETVGYLIFQHVDIGDPSRDAALRCADNVIRRVAEEIERALSTYADHYPVDVFPGRCRVRRSCGRIRLGGGRGERPVPYRG